MGESTHIEWCDHTFNPWIGCARVSPGCLHCYAETLDTRWSKGQHWGKNAERRVTSDRNWQAPRKWNAKAEADGVRRRVFCASLADVFEDRDDLMAPRERLWRLIGATPHLDWLLLTKRPENLFSMLPWTGAIPWVPDGRGGLTEAPDEDWGVPWPNVWLGTSVEDQQRANERVPLLLDTPAAVRFLSAEPLLGPVDLARVDLGMKETQGYGSRLIRWNALTGFEEQRDVARPNAQFPRCSIAGANPGVDWVIVGGESGLGARPMQVDWARDLVQQCADAGVAVHVKQLGAVWARQHAALLVDVDGVPDIKGGDWAWWPEDLRIRQWPAPVRVSGG